MCRYVNCRCCLKISCGVEKYCCSFPLRNLKTGSSPKLVVVTIDVESESRIHAQICVEPVCIQRAILRKNFRSAGPLDRCWEMTELHLPLDDGKMRAAAFQWTCQAFAYRNMAPTFHRKTTPFSSPDTRPAALRRLLINTAQTGTPSGALKIRDYFLRQLFPIC